MIKRLINRFIHSKGVTKAAREGSGIARGGKAVSLGTACKEPLSFGAIPGGEKPNRAIQLQHQGGSRSIVIR